MTQKEMPVNRLYEIADFWVLDAAHNLLDQSMYLQVQGELKWWFVFIVSNSRLFVRLLKNLPRRSTILSGRYIF
jgi:hypothetical protein